MSEAPQRRRLLAGLSESPKPPTATLPEATIAQAAARHGFAENPVAAPPPESSVGTTITVRRQRQSTGRTEQFNVRLKPETLEAIYAEANGRDIPLAQVIEEAITLLRAPH